jgi:hypothetical protein
MTEFEAQVLSDLAALKAQMKALLGNGQPGRLNVIEAKVERHEALVNRAAGIGALGGVALTAVHLAIDYLRFRH